MKTNQIKSQHQSSEHFLLVFQKTPANLRFSKKSSRIQSFTAEKVYTRTILISFIFLYTHITLHSLSIRTVESLRHTKLLCATWVTTTAKVYAQVCQMQSDLTSWACPAQTPRITNTSSTQPNAEKLNPINAPCSQVPTRPRWETAGTLLTWSKIKSIKRSRSSYLSLETLQ